VFVCLQYELEERKTFPQYAMAGSSVHVFPPYIALAASSPTVTTGFLLALGNEVTEIPNSIHLGISGKDILRMYRIYENFSLIIGMINRYQVDLGRGWQPEECKSVYIGDQYSMICTCVVYVDDCHDFFCTSSRMGLRMMFILSNPVSIIRWYRIAMTPIRYRSSQLSLEDNPY